MRASAKPEPHGGGVISAGLSLPSGGVLRWHRGRCGMAPLTSRAVRCGWPLKCLLLMWLSQLWLCRGHSWESVPLPSHQPCLCTVVRVRGCSSVGVQLCPPAVPAAGCGPPSPAVRGQGAARNPQALS